MKPRTRGGLKEMGGYCNIRSPVFFQSKLFGSLGGPDGLVEKHLPAMQETQEMGVRSLGREDPPEEEVATHSRILAWRIPWTGEPCRLQSMRSQRVRHD